MDRNRRNRGENAALFLLATIGLLSVFTLGWLLDLY
jgi:hypothetical protein